MNKPNTPTQQQSAPERIYVWTEGPHEFHDTRTAESDIEYVRIDLLTTVRAEARAEAFKEAMKIVDDAGTQWGDLARRSKTYSAYVIAALDLKGQLEAAALERAAAITEKGVNDGN